jgi:hypothetical protein
MLTTLDEGKVVAVISLYDQGLLPVDKQLDRSNNIKRILYLNLAMSLADASYWLKFFGE